MTAQIHTLVSYLARTALSTEQLTMEGQAVLEQFTRLRPPAQRPYFMPFRVSTTIPTEVFPMVDSRFSTTAICTAPQSTAAARTTRAQFMELSQMVPLRCCTVL